MTFLVDPTVEVFKLLPKTLVELTLAQVDDQFAGTTSKGRNESQNGIVWVALNDVHVQVVQALTHDVEDARGDFAEIGVLVEMLEIIRTTEIGGIHTLGFTFSRTTSSQCRRWPMLVDRVEVTATATESITIAESRDR